jgi:hypothetical protein
VDKILEQYVKDLKNKSKGKTQRAKGKSERPGGREEDAVKRQNAPAQET